MDSDSTAEPIVETPQVAETDFKDDSHNPESVAPEHIPESAPAEPTLEDFLAEFERDTAASGEPVSGPILGATEAAPATPEAAPAQPELSDPVQRIVDDVNASYDLRREASQLDAARQEFVRAAAERDFKQVYSDLTTSLAKDFPHIPPDLVGTIVAGRLFQLANSDRTVVAAFDNRHSNPRFYAGVIKHI